MATAENATAVVARPAVAGSPAEVASRALVRSPAEVASPAEVESPAEVGRTLRRTLAAGAALGALAFAGDELPGLAGDAVFTLFGNGFAWGAAALVTGYLVRGARRAAGVATGLLLVATAVYYQLILVVSRRWSGGYQEDGSSHDPLGLLSVARAAAFWLAMSVVAGLVLGLLGNLIRERRPRLAAVAAGVAGGLLAAEGMHTLWVMQPWRGAGLSDAFYLTRLATYAATVLLAVVIVTALVSRRRPRCWSVYAMSLAPSAALGALAWHAVDAVRGVL
jgi:hypothetical protein